MPLDRRVLIAAAALGICGAILPITGSSHAATPPQSASTLSPEPRAPEAIYARTCGYCHGHNVGPVIRDRNLPPEAIAYMVRRGQGAMPAFRPTEITDTELKALAAWISTSKADSKEHGQ